MFICRNDQQRFHCMWALIECPKNIGMQRLFGIWHWHRNALQFAIGRAQYKGQIKRKICYTFRALIIVRCECSCVKSSNTNRHTTQPMLRMNERMEWMVVENNSMQIGKRKKDKLFHCGNTRFYICNWWWCTSMHWCSSNAYSLMSGIWKISVGLCQICRVHFQLCFMDDDGWWW